METNAVRAERIETQLNESRTDLIKFINSINLSKEDAELYDESLQIEHVQKFYNRIVKTIEETYQIDKELGMKLIIGSWMPEITIEIPEYFFHYSSRKWAEDLIDWGLTICRKE